MTKGKQQKLIEEFKTRAVVGRHSVARTETPYYHGTFNAQDYDNSFRLDDFKENLRIDIVSTLEGDGLAEELHSNKDEGTLVFDLVGVEAPIANSFRRIMIAEVPTMAIDTVVVVNNTSVLVDEVLAHRVGLVPLKVDPRYFEYKRELQDRMDEMQSTGGKKKKSAAAAEAGADAEMADDDEEAAAEIEGEELTAEEEERRNREIYKRLSGYGRRMPGVTADVGGSAHEKPQLHLYDYETLLFKVDINCKKKPGAPPSNDNLDPEQDLVHSRVYSRDLKWVPFGNQAEIFKHAPVRPVHDDILLCKLRAGQGVTLECYAQKGIGKDHAKFSPVATAAYRLLPEIAFKQVVRGEQAKELKEKCPMNVFDIEDGEAVVARPRDCTMCRECIREEGWEKKIELRRVKNHFIFSIESTGAWEPQDIFLQSVRILREKCLSVKRTIQKQTLGQQ